MEFLKKMLRCHEATEETVKNGIFVEVTEATELPTEATELSRKPRKCHGTHGSATEATEVPRKPRKRHGNDGHRFLALLPPYYMIMMQDVIN